MEIRFKKRQMACMKRIWDHRAWDLGLAEEPLLERSIEEDETEANENEAEDPTWTGPKDDELGGAVSELLEFLFEPNIMFIADEFTNGQPFSNLLF
jgi:hypothetical protein